MRELRANIKVEPVINPAAAITDNTVQVGTSIDHQGFDSKVYSMHYGAINDAGLSVTPLLEESDDDVTFTAVADNDMNSTEAAETVDETADNTIRTLGYIGGKRYSRLTLTPAGNAADLFLSASCIQSNPWIAPTTQN